MLVPICFTFLGLMILLTGIKILRDGLEKFTGSYFQLVLQKFTATTARGFISGILATSILQSSTALTVMAISFVDAGLLSFQNTLGLILGSNIGSTVTPQLLSLPLKDFAIWLVPPGFLGFWLLKGKIKFFCYALAGLGLMFFSLSVLESAMIPLASTSYFQERLLHLNSSYLESIVAGTVLSAALHSSSATAGLVMVLTERGWLDLPTSLAFIFGANIGTCFTALIVSAFTSRSAQCVALFHVFVNVFGVLMFYPLLDPLTEMIRFLGGSLSRQIANGHTIFNILSSLMVLPLLPYISRLLARSR